MTSLELPISPLGDEPKLDDLVARARDGSHAAFDALALRVRDRVRVWAARLTRDQDDAEDVAQLVLRRLHRQVARFNGYRLLSQNTVWVNDGASFETTMRGPSGDQLTVTGNVEGVRRDGSKSVQLYVSLSHNARQAEMVAGAVQTGTAHQELLRTGLSIPMGQTVVVGSAMTGGSTPAIILTVRPEPAPVKP